MEFIFSIDALHANLSRKYFAKNVNKLEINQEAV